ncbi:hypothetical protein [Actinomadura sp. SCN-SB]|uniref:hypothetical protein n=1 Tax=Actinomadura sp. SCN-SB TaxID=3373092 RepID=UPI0037529F60
MARTKTRRSRIRKIAALATASTAAAAVLSVPGVAQAAPFLNVSYPFTGTSHIAGPDDDLALGPGTLSARLDVATGEATASVNLPPASGSFELIGFLPVSTTVTFTEVGQSTAFVDPRGGATEAKAKMNIKLSNVKIAGIPALVGNNCQTETPVDLTLNSGPDWGVLTGGTFTGTYTIPKFENCLLSTWLINLVIPGANNTITLNLSTPTVTPG